MKLSFTKMHGLGNDFVVFDFTRTAYPLSSQQAAQIADRHFGIGCDQILIVEKSNKETVDFKYRILNSDGSEVNQCGNGARCFARFVRERGLSNNNPIVVETNAGELSLYSEPNSNQVTVDMGVPRFEPGSVPLVGVEMADRYSINKDGDAIEFFAVSMGNPHAVIQVEDVTTAPVSLVGPMLESHPMFPERTNVGFMQINSPSEIALRVFERGVGETLACGSGACAAVACGVQAGLLEQTVSVSLPGGRLTINWSGGDSSVLMTGPTEVVFEGEIESDNL